MFGIIRIWLVCSFCWRTVSLFGSYIQSSNATKRNRKSQRRPRWWKLVRPICRFLLQSRAILRRDVLDAQIQAQRPAPTLEGPGRQFRFTEPAKRTQREQFHASARTCATIFADRSLVAPSVAIAR